MERYIGIDSGKYATKVAVYDKDTESTKLHKFRTKISEGNFLDDALEKATYISEINGQVYKVGNNPLIKPIESESEE